MPERPLEHLGEAVDLIVEASTRKCPQLRQEYVEPLKGTVKPNAPLFSYMVRGRIWRLRIVIRWPNRLGLFTQSKT
jgi:hypothetical protein